ncbi:MAG TPA: DUF459 domain-containing protein [Treponemataceae bacterium]|nr:DUF459 domain-containing protein [Treponemataceae bacterium]
MDKAFGTKREDRSSPNGVLATVAVALIAFSLLCGQSLWIPASRISDLHLRAIALAMTDAASSFAESAGLDGYVPEARDAFLAATGLSDHPDWDGRYFNRRSADSEMATGSPNAPGADAAVGTETATGTGTAGDSSLVTVEERPAAAEGGLAQAIPFAMISPALGPDASAQNGDPQGAQSAGAPAKLPARTATIHSPDNPLKVFFFGDSQVFSLGSGLSRDAGKGSGISVDILAIHSSGFIRSDYYDWPAKLKDTLGQTPYDAAVLMLGMNDHQSFRDSAGTILKKESPEWNEAYKEKCRELIDLALASVPRVYWIGMPVVKNGVYEKGLDYIDKIQSEVALEYSPNLVVRVSLRDAIPGAGKPYADSVSLPGGKSLRVMAGDGAHFTVEGGQLAMKPLFDLLCADYPFSEVPVAKLPE